MNWGDERVAQRIWDRVFPCPMSGCWLVDGHDNGAGYQKVGVGGKRREYAHRLFFVANHGPIPSGLVLDHKCRVRSCCNPQHLEAVTSRENTRRGVGIGKWDRRGPRKVKMYSTKPRRRTHCYLGHPLVEQRSGRQECPECKRLSLKRRYDASRESGVCVQSGCKRSAASGRVMCENHLESTALSSRRKRARR